MKLSSIHSTDGLPHQNRVIQREEHQGAKHKKHWYQKYHKKAKPYKQSHTTGPKPEGYEEHIMK